MCYGKFSIGVPVVNLICEKSTANEAWLSRHFQNTAGEMGTAVCIYNANFPAV